MAEIFISHSSADAPAAATICAAIERDGLRCWIASRDILPGENYAEAIVNALDRCRVMVLVLSTHANESAHVAREVERAVSRGVTIIPVRIEDVVPAKALAYFIGASHRLEAWPPPIEPHLRQLVRAIRDPLGAAPSKSTSDSSPISLSSSRKSPPTPLVWRLRLTVLVPVAVVVVVVAAIVSLYNRKSSSSVVHDEKPDSPNVSAMAPTPDILPRPVFTDDLDRDIGSGGILSGTTRREVNQLAEVFPSVNGECRATLLYEGEVAGIRCSRDGLSFQFLKYESAGELENRYQAMIHEKTFHDVRVSKWQCGRLIEIRRDDESPLLVWTRDDKFMEGSVAWPTNSDGLPSSSSQLLPVWTNKHLGGRCQ